MNSLLDTIEAFALVTGPGAGAVLATAAVSAPGFYRVDVTSYTSGTSSAADSDNVALNVPGDTAYVVPSQQATAANSGAEHTWYVTMLAAGNITLTAIGAAGAAAVYHVALKVTLWPSQANDRTT